jgi:hypothetical protein
MVMAASFIASIWHAPQLPLVGEWITEPWFSQIGRKSSNQEKTEESLIEIAKWKKAIWEDTLLHKTQNHGDSKQ